MLRISTKRGGSLEAAAAAAAPRIKSLWRVICSRLLLAILLLCSLKHTRLARAPLGRLANLFPFAALKARKWPSGAHIIHAALALRRRITGALARSLSNFDWHKKGGRANCCAASGSDERPLGRADGRARRQTGAGWPREASEQANQSLASSSIMPARKPRRAPAASLAPGAAPNLNVTLPRPQLGVGGARPNNAPKWPARSPTCSLAHNSSAVGEQRECAGRLANWTSERVRCHTVGKLSALGRRASLEAQR